MVLWKKRLLGMSVEKEVWEMDKWSLADKSFPVTVRCLSIFNAFFNKLFFLFTKTE